MLGGLYGLSFLQRSYITMAQLCPMVVAYIGIHKFDDGLLTLVMILTLYITLPMIYIRYLSNERELTAYFINEFRNKSQQLKAGLQLCGSAFGMVLLSYIYTYFNDEQVGKYLKFPLRNNLPYLFIFFFLFTFLNPLLEELFWRIFIMKTNKETEFQKMQINISYTAMHFIILCYILNLEMAIGFGTYFYSVGRAFEFIREKYGLITCLMTHYGMTLASSFALEAIIVLQIHQNKIR